jgi:hypothetical protein
VLYGVFTNQANTDDAAMFKSIMGDGASDGSDNDNSSSGRPAVLLALVDDAVSGCIIVTGTHGSGKREVLITAILCNNNRLYDLKVCSNFARACWCMSCC